MKKAMTNDMEGLNDITHNKRAVKFGSDADAETCLVSHAYRAAMQERPERCIPDPIHLA